MDDNKKRYFGTDGIRGYVGHNLITPEFMLKLGWATGTVLKDKPLCQLLGINPVKKVLISKDTRISGYMLESAMIAGFTASGMPEIILLGPMPTPAVAYFTRQLGAAGIVISASHNGYEDNGIKFFSSQGTKLSDAVELAIEAQLGKSMQCVTSAKLGKASRLKDAPDRYIEFCKQTIPNNMSFSGLKLAVDCANGATYHIAPNVFRELGAKVIACNNKPNGLNINANCGSTQPKSLQDFVVSRKMDVGIAFDGDGDRVIMVDHTGRLVDGDDILYIIGRYTHDLGELNGGVVGTSMSNLGLEYALTDQGIPFVRTKVGDRHIVKTLQEKHWLLGGEPSGHIICFEKNTSGDAIIGALQVLRIMRETQQPLSVLLNDLKKFPQHMINIKKKSQEDYIHHPSTQDEIIKIKTKLGTNGRVVLRSSGTEPVIRIMVEGENSKQVKQAAERLAQWLDQA